MKTNSMIYGVLALLISIFTFAQADKESNISLEITREIDGEEETFKDQYKNTEEMKADTSYQAFVEKDKNFEFWIENDRHHHRSRKSHKGRKFLFMSADSTNEESNRFIFKHDSNASVMIFLDKFLDSMDLKKHKHQLEDIEIEVEGFLDKEMEEKISRKIRVNKIKRIKISDVNDEFGKRGGVKESNKLQLNKLEFYPNPSSRGRIKIHFGVPEKGELIIRVSNRKGKEIFRRYFENFEGIYSEMIDLSGQKDGIYLLEIQQGKKRVAKKMIID